MAKKEVRWYLGLADLSSPLTDLTLKGAPDLVQWTEQSQDAFVQVKKALCREPLPPPFYSAERLLEQRGPFCPRR